ncbi:MAG: ABC transporter permease [Dehalococcoidia bacterium]|nr:ABC transporter permease [Dehalococcoidia bacterium]
MYFAGVLSNLIAPYGYNEFDTSHVRQGPSMSHWFGTDFGGRDLLSRIIYGLRSTVIVTIITIAFGSLLLGIVLGAIAGYKGGIFEAVIMRIGDIFLAFPGLLFVIIIAATVKPRVLELNRWIEDHTFIKGLVSTGVTDYIVIFGALSLISWVSMARLVRGQILSIKREEYVMAAIALGATDAHIIRKHIVPNVLSQIIVVLSGALGAIALSEASLSFLGIGVQPPTPSLGNLLTGGSVSLLQANSHLVFFPAAVVAVLLFCFNMVGDAVNDAVNPRTR